MLEHHIQKNIVYALALAPGYRFSELKPDGMENKLFDYHLKKVVSAGYVEKSEDGTYVLTSKGRRMGKDAIRREDYLINRAYSVLFLVVRRSDDGAWLLCRRKAHPLLGKVGFPNSQPELTEHVTDTATNALREKCALDGAFTVRGSGYLRMYHDSELESFTHYTMLECTNPAGELQQLDTLAEYFWEQSPNVESPDMLPSIEEFMKKLEEPGLFYLEADYQSV